MSATTQHGRRPDGRGRRAGPPSSRSCSWAPSRNGYGVLLFDRRGEGASEGDPNALGWGGVEDLRAAIDELKAVVSDGADIRSVREASLTEGAGVVGAVGVWSAMTVSTAVFSNEAPPNLKDVVGRIAPRPIFLVGFFDRALLR